MRIMMFQLSGKTTLGSLDPNHLNEVSEAVCRTSTSQVGDDMRDNYNLDNIPFHTKEGIETPMQTL